MSDNKINNPTPLQLQDKCLSCGGCSCEISHDDERCNLQCTNYLADIPGNAADFDVVEVHFKNTRKGFYRNSANLPIKVGDLVAVEANPGHDIGRVSMMGRLVKLQMKKANLRGDHEILRIFRKAKPADLERWEAAKAREADTMIRSRQIAADLKLKMKIGDVEYQGDGNKAIFYYIADERVDFRQLIKVLADTFKIRIEMKQIGARQEAGRIGGIGPCGRPLCCASWMTNFVSVATSAARIQDISLNPQKLAGQCAKLKCCINFEVDSYVEASRKMPHKDVVLETKNGKHFIFKTDLFKQQVTFTTEKNQPTNLVTLPLERVWEIVALNKQGVQPDSLRPEGDQPEVEKPAFGDIIGQDSISRFDKKKKKKKSRGSAASKAKNKEGSAAGAQPSKENGDQPKQDNKSKNGNNRRRNEKKNREAANDNDAAKANTEKQRPKSDNGAGGRSNARNSRRHRPQGQGKPQQNNDSKPQNAE